MRPVTINLQDLGVGDARSAGSLRRTCAVRLPVARWAAVVVLLAFSSAGPARSARPDGKQVAPPTSSNAASTASTAGPTAASTAASTAGPTPPTAAPPALMPVQPTGAADAAPTGAASSGALGLRDALRAAVADRLDVTAARERATARAVVVDGALLPFIPRLLPTLSVGQGQVPVAGPFNTYFQADDVVATRRVTAGLSLAGDLPVGPSYELGVTGLVSWFSSYAEAVNPRYEPGLRLRLSQRLWRGAWPETTLAPRDAALAAAVAEAALVDVRVDAVLAEVTEAWTNAARAEALLEPRRRSVDSAQQFQKLTQQLIDGGSLSGLDLALARQIVAQRQADLARAEVERDLALLSLVTALGAPTLQPGAAPAGVDVDAAPEVPSVDHDVAAARAVERSPSLRALRANLAQVRHLQRRAVDDTRPDIRVFVDGGVNGLAGTTTCKNGFLTDGISACNVPAAYEGGADRALYNLATAKGYSVVAGISGDIPLWFGPTDAGLAGRDHDVLALGAEQQTIERRLAADARRLTADVDARRRLLALRSQNVGLAVAALAAEEQKLRAGRSSGFALARAQELAIDAEVQETEARFDLIAAGLRLRAFMGTLLGDAADDDISDGPTPLATPASSARATPTP